jgi:two-component system, NtrC family, response regulator HydG
MKARILVIDDEESIRFTFDRFLKDAGYEVHTAGTFGEGIGKLTDHDFDLVFADIILGCESGIDLFRAIKERHLLCPLVLITGYPTLETAAEAVRLGAFDYLPKPVPKETLLPVTRLALMQKNLMDTKEQYRSNLEAIFNTVKDAILLVDGDLGLLEFNDAARNFFGFSPDSIGKPLGSLMEARNGKCLDTVAEAIEQKRIVELEHFECHLESGNTCVATLSATPILDPGGNFAGAVVVVKDETRLVDLERDLCERRQFHNMVGKAERMQRIYTLVDDLANLQTSVLVTGESGTGKELLAEAIHFRGERRNRPLVKVNCSALSENLLESELFGHVRGAFTGAVKDKIGRFQLADGGTIFLDEIGDVSLNIQQRLLRVLQEREFERVGDSRTTKVDVRVIAATNKNLPEKIRLGEFREDLFYRLKVVEISLPPLRERKEDIPLLLAHYVDKFNGKLRKTIDGVSEDVLQVFMNHPWPGNVRQLAHTIEHAFIVCHQNIVTLEHLPLDLREAVAKVGAHRTDEDQKTNERHAILKALEKTAGNKAMAARLLGIGRRTIHRKILEHRLTRAECGGKCVP